jgi:uncharacterized protein (DUF169 family)
MGKNSKLEIMVVAREEDEEEEERKCLNSRVCHFIYFARHKSEPLSMLSLCCHSTVAD